MDGGEVEGDEEDDKDTDEEGGEDEGEEDGDADEGRKERSAKVPPHTASEQVPFTRLVLGSDMETTGVRSHAGFLTILSQGLKIMVQI